MGFLQVSSYRLRAHADLIPEHTRAHAAITPPPLTFPLDQGRAELEFSGWA